MSEDDPPIRILIIDDDPTEALLVKISLRDANFELETAESIAGAHNTLSEFRFDLIVLDLSLPDASGVEALEAMEEYLGKCALVVMTGLDDPGMRTRLISMGAQDYLVKGELAGPDLATALRRAVERFRLAT